MSSRLEECSRFQYKVHDLICNDLSNLDYHEGWKNQGEAILLQISGLLDQAIPENHPLKSLYDLGAALGRCEYHIYDTMGVDSPGDHWEEQTLDSLILVADRVPQAVLGRCPSLQRLLELAGSRLGPTALDFVEELVESVFGKGDEIRDGISQSAEDLLVLESFRSVTSDFQEALDEAPALDFAETSTVASRDRTEGDSRAAFHEDMTSEQRPSDDQITESRYNTPEPLSTDPATEASKDRSRLEGMGSGNQSGVKWDKEKGELYFDSKLARKVRGSAINVSKLLDKFQEMGWPDQVDDPLDELEKPKHERNPECLKDTVRSLNKNLKFSREGRAMRVKWSRASKQD